MSNGLSGTMLAKGDHFEVDGMPVVPMGDDLVWSPHAMIPSRVSSDAAQAVQYQGAPLPLSDCNVCHPTSRGLGLSQFDEAHAGPSPEAANACRICHTVVPGAADVARWPHGYGWKTRSIAY